MSEPLIGVAGVSSGYGHIRVLRDIDLALEHGEVVALLGANGAGKSTLLRTIAGLLTPDAGAITYDGAPIGGMSPERLVRRGVALVPEGRLLFGSMSVADNLLLGAYAISGAERARRTAANRELVHRLFPVLAERAEQAAATLSGGEQQMLAVGRALMSGPRVLLLDEPSLGLAPKVIAEIFSAIDALRRGGVSVLLAEQDARLALRHADRGYVMATGRIVLSGRAQELLADDTVRRIYLGSTHDEGSASR